MIKKAGIVSRVNWLGCIQCITGVSIIIHFLLSRLSLANATEQFDVEVQRDEFTNNYLIIQRPDLSNYERCLSFSNYELADVYLIYRNSWLFFLVCVLYLLTASIGFYWNHHVTVEALFRKAFQIICDGVFLCIVAICCVLFTGEDGCVTNLYGITFFQTNLSWFFQVLNNGGLMLSTYYIIRTLIKAKRFTLILQRLQVKHAAFIGILKPLATVCGLIAKAVAIFLPLFAVALGSIFFRIILYVSFPSYAATYILLIRDFALSFTIVFNSKSILLKFLTRGTNGNSAKSTTSENSQLGSGKSEP